MDCPVCKVPMVRRKSKFGDNFWWGCSNYPECKITSAEHPDGRLMSTPADPILKTLRMRVHSLLEEVFGNWNDKTAKNNMYAWLKDNTKSGHIGLMDKDEVLDTITKLKAIGKDDDQKFYDVQQQ